MWTDLCLLHPLPVDDVLNVSGHRIGTAEVESALVLHDSVAQAAVVGKPHEIKGQAIAAFVMLNEGKEESPELLKELNQYVCREIVSDKTNMVCLRLSLSQSCFTEPSFASIQGKFAAPDLIIVAPSLPMTRSGKIMRRILRKIVCGEADSLGDISTLADPSIVAWTIEKWKTYA